MEPPKKQQKIDEGELKEILLSMHSSFLNKLKSIEDKIETISCKYIELEGKVENIFIKIKESSFKVSHPSLSCSAGDSGVSKLITTNSEDLYPNGSWLGNPKNSELRVRCNISPLDLQTINSSCSTAEKMALTLLDYLFDREVQAKSNVSGTGRHGKEQLDPLKIYGIKCHLMYAYNINQKEWLRIRQNIDSKCRTAFRRKQKGLPLYAKRSRERLPQDGEIGSSQINRDSRSDAGLLENSSQQDILIKSIYSQTLDYDQEPELGHILPLKLDPDGYSLTFTDNIGTQIIHTEHGDIQVIQATEEQLEQLKQSHHIEILSQADILTETLDVED